MIKNLRFVVMLLIFLNLQSVYAHGSMEIPISRVLNCYKENPESPKSDACKAAVQFGGTQALYDWNGINQAAANDRHQDIIPDGKLCSAAKDEFKGLDLPRNDWVTTSMVPNGNNQFDFSFWATAPHATKYFKFYITKPTYDFTQPLKWSDLESQPFCTITSVTVVNAHYKMTCPFPSGTGKRLIYVIWQRSDSPEAFYSCSDVVLGGGGVQTPWNELANFIANSDINPGVKIKFRLLKNGADLESYTITATAGQNLASQWPYYLGLEINSKSTLVNLGQLDANTGVVTPVQSATLNKVYVKDSNLTPYNFVVDFISVNEDFDYIYPDGINKYVGGTIVLGFDKKRYKCKPFPASGWCSQSPFYYEPGRGLAWQMAWDLLS